MFRDVFQSGFLSLFCSVGQDPLQLWREDVKDGVVKRVHDPHIQCTVTEITGTGVSTNFLACPASTNPKHTLGIRLPIFVMLVKGLGKVFACELQVLDDRGMRRRIRVSNFTSKAQTNPQAVSIPVFIPPAQWSQVELNLSDILQQAFDSRYVETQRVQVHANCRIHRVYFAERAYTDEELPKDFRLPMARLPPSAMEAGVSQGAGRGGSGGRRGGAGGAGEGGEGTVGRRGARPRPGSARRSGVGTAGAAGGSASAWR